MDSSSSSDSQNEDVKYLYNKYMRFYSQPARFTYDDDKSNSLWYWYPEDLDSVQLEELADLFRDFLDDENEELGK